MDFLCGCSAGAKPTLPSSPTKGTAAGNGRWPRPKSITGNCWRNGGRRRGNNAAGGPKSEDARARPASLACDKSRYGDTARCENFGWRPGVQNRMSSGAGNFRFGHTGQKRPENWQCAPGEQDCGARNKGQSQTASAAATCCIQHFWKGEFPKQKYPPGEAANVCFRNGMRKARVNTTSR